MFTMPHLPLTLALSLYWPLLFLAMIGGVVLFIATLFRRRGWWWKLPAAVALMVGPYVLDVARSRVSEGGESWGSALVPTTALLMMMQPDNRWPYGTVFDRLHKAPPRHAMWESQLDKLAAWCRACLASKEAGMAMRGAQIAATIAGRGSDEAVAVLGEALMHGDAAVATLACDAMMSLGRRLSAARESIGRAIAESPHAEVRQRAENLRAIMNAPDEDDGG